MGLRMAWACASMLVYRMNPPGGKWLVSFQVSRLRETRLMRLGGMMLFGKGAALPGRRIARVAAGLASRGYHRLPGSSSSEKSPLRMASVGALVVEGVARRSFRASQLNSQNVRSFFTGPETTPPYWLRRSLFLGWLGGRKKPRASNRSLRTNSNSAPCRLLVPDLIATLTCAPEFTPNSAEYTALCTLNSSIASIEGVKLMVLMRGSVATTPSSVMRCWMSRWPLAAICTVWPGIGVPPCPLFPLRLVP